MIEAAVVGQPHPALGDVPIAYVALHPERTSTESELNELCAEHLTKVKIPVSITILESLPKNPVGKIDKPALRSQVVRTPAGQGA